MLHNLSNVESKFVTNKWCGIESQTEKIKSSLCGYSDAFILVTADTTVTADNNTDVAFKNCAPFSTCKTDSFYWWSKSYLHYNAYVQFDRILW